MKCMSASSYNNVNEFCIDKDNVIIGKHCLCSLGQFVFR